MYFYITIKIPWNFKSLRFNQEWHHLVELLIIDGFRGVGGTGAPDPSLKNHKNIGFHSKPGPDPWKNHKATKPAFNVGQSSARQRDAISMAFRWLANNGPLLVVFGPSLPLSIYREKKRFLKKRSSELDPL